MDHMILTADVGNTSITFGLFKGKRLLRSWRTAAKDASVKTILPNLRGAIDGMCVSSVVPHLDPILKKAVKKSSKCKTLFVTHGNAGIKIRRYNKKQIGVDRLVNAVAAYEKYKGPLIVVDFGTATTFDYITPRGEYGGGVIAPGIGIINDALYKMTAKLPKVGLKMTKNVVAQNTRNSMQSGVFHGYVGLVDHIIRKMKNEVGSRPVVIATGGFACLVAPHTKAISSIEPFLTLHGLRIIWEKNNSRTF